MANNYIKPGEHLTFTADVSITFGNPMLSGGVVLLGTLLGVALTTIADNTNGEAAVEGVWRLPKKNGQVINAWSKPIWSLSEAAFVNKDAAAGDLINSCIAVETAGASARTVKVKLLPGAGRVQT